MGASHEMGWNEICLWGSAVTSVVQPIHRPPSAPSVGGDPGSPWRLRVFRLTVWPDRFLIGPPCEDYGGPSIPQPALWRERYTGCCSGTTNITAGCITLNTVLICTCVLIIGLFFLEQHFDLLVWIFYLTYYSSQVRSVSRNHPNECWRCTCVSTAYHLSTLQSGERITSGRNAQYSSGSRHGNPSSGYALLPL